MNELTQVVAVHCIVSHKFSSFFVYCVCESQARCHTVCVSLSLAVLYMLGCVCTRAPFVYYTYIFIGTNDCTESKSNALHT